MYTEIELVLTQMSLILKDVTATEVCGNGFIRLGIGDEKRPLGRERLITIQTELSYMFGEFRELPGGSSLPYSIQITEDGAQVDLFLDPKYFTIWSWETSEEVGDAI